MAKKYGNELKLFILGGIVILIIGSILFLESQKAKPVNSTAVKNNGDFAPELTAIAGYINTEPGITVESLRGKVVMIDFWTYSCINCIRTQPYLNAWYDKYESDGLVIIGVHTPEFEFEKDINNVRKAVKNENIKYPVVLDNDFGTWQAYRNSYWPRKYLIDINGKVRYDHIGEGGYDETEMKIQELLAERNSAKKTGLVAPNNTISIGNIGSPEIYFGYGFNRGSFGQELKPETVVNYSFPSSIKFNTAYLDGQWYNANDYVELEGDKGSILLPYHSKAVNIVAGSEFGSSVIVYIDEKPINDSDKGFDLGKPITDEKLYNLVRSKDSGNHLIEINVTGKGFRIYTFTFG